MDILTSCAKWLDQSLYQLVGGKASYTRYADVFNAKVGIFNGSTVAIGASTVLVGLLSLKAAALLCGCFWLVRQVAYKSFAIAPAQAATSLQLKAALQLGEVVIFYNTVPRTLSKVVDNIADEAKNVGLGIGGFFAKLLKG